MGQKFSDAARALLTITINAANTSLTIEGTYADDFPVANTIDWGTKEDWFKVVLQDTVGNREVIHVGTRASGSNVLGNVLRGQDGTTAQSWTAGSAIVFLDVLAADIENVLAGQLPPGTTLPEVVTQDGVVGRITPVGGIIMWSGTIAALPAGWALCDGNNGTPDLRDKFIVAASQDSAGETKTNITGALTKTGGSKDAIVVTHSHTGTTGTESSDHSHSGTTSMNGAHQHRHQAAQHNSIWQGYSEGYGLYGGGTMDDAALLLLTESNGNHQHTFTTGGRSAAHTHTFNTSVQGSSGTNANLVPYFALAFIMCLGAA